ncbi:MAG: hypothetical protein ACYDEC_09655 [Bacteroidia bacterium]
MRQTPILIPSLREGLVFLILLVVFLLPFGAQWRKRIILWMIIAIGGLAGQRGYAHNDRKVVPTVDTAECLIITGSFDGTVKDFEGTYTAKLLRDNKVIDSQVLSIKKKFAFILDRDVLYAIKIEKEGYISKTISVSTFLPSKVEVGSPYRFHLKTNLLSVELSGHFNDDDVDFPVALVSYGNVCDCFEFNKAYTNSLIKRMVNNLLFGE